MRVTTNLIFNQNLRAINSSQGNLSDIQTQLASGKKLLRPSDDPVGASQVIRLTEEIDKISQYQRNNDLVTNALELQETTLRSINDVVNRARVLTVQSGNGILSAPDKIALGAEIEQLRNQLVDLMNSQNASGEYIFSGYQSGQQAFEFNPSASNNRISFVGDDGTNIIQLSDSVSIQSTSSGKSLFEDVQARLNFSLPNVSGAVVENYQIKNQGSFDQFHRENFDPVNDANNAFRFTIVSANEIQVSNIGTGQILDSLVFESGQDISFNGIQLNAVGVPGDTFDIELNRPKKANMAETLHTLFLALNDPNLSEQEYTSIIDDTLVGLDNGLTRMARENSSLGARLNIAQSVESAQLDAEIANQQARSAIEDVDYAEASSEFAKQETALEAAFASFPRIANLSLFNYI
ncbi:flagellar hook-associated protein FlgL [Glaciecola petra]|uniref:Flagellar hook-associated protein FlgL n=1 Tax=Glaciecola petra TaxID=3075602 RepID=A0ABU2ZMD6_9ALTE|nr:flagellar hook-associated protein FlgL [Aestuariibacter sp. P117]MDT0593793.1 flagellar hook-associated protein FlgL [Aestuariibacter sp. P117]